jgi:hypothetical protein
MARTTLIRVSFSRQVSDGNYGSETIRHEVEVTADDGQDLSSEESITALDLCRRLVHAELARSPNWSIRHAIEEPKTLSTAELAPSNYDDDEDLPL